MGIVYLLTAPDGKRYVGQTIDLEKRMAGYRRYGAPRQRKLHRAIIKHGWDSFAVAVLMWGVDGASGLNQAERAFIAMLGTIDDGLNCRVGGGAASPETRAKISASLCGRKLSAEARAKIGVANARRVVSVETRAKMSAARLGKRRGPHSQDTREKISAKLRGRQLSPEHCAAMAAARRGRKHSPETAAKIASANRGRKHTAEARANMSAGQRGRKHSKETREKMRESRRVYLARRKSVCSNATQKEIQFAV